MSITVNDGQNCLHLVLSHSQEALENCLVVFREGDTLLFLDAGVLHLPGLASADGEMKEAIFMRADLQARGLQNAAVACGFRVMGDEGFAVLLAAHSHCLSWK